MEETLRQWGSRDSAGYGYLLDFYRRGARVCYASADALVLKHNVLNICYAAGAAVDVPVLHTATLSMVEDRALAEALLSEGVYQQCMVCRQAYYARSEPPRPRRCPAVLRPLNMEDLDFLLEHYHHPGAYASHLRGRIAEGMLGAEVQGRLAGFIGLHQEGTIGLLEVLPAFRRQGIAEALEAAMIARQLDRGGWPYVHVMEGNTASERLQETLGMTFDDRRGFYWLCPA